MLLSSREQLYSLAMVASTSQCCYCTLIDYLYKKHNWLMRFKVVYPSFEDAYCCNVEPRQLNQMLIECMNIAIVFYSTNSTELIFIIFFSVLFCYLLIYFCDFVKCFVGKKNKSEKRKMNKMFLLRLIIKRKNFRCVHICLIQYTFYIFITKNVL